MRKVILILIACVICSGCTSMKKSMQPQTIAPLVDDHLVEVYVKDVDFTGKQLKELAVKSGVIPAEADYAYFQKNKTEQNTTAIWLVYSGDEKTAVIDSFKRVFKIRGAVVSKPSDYYADRINGVLFVRIRNGNFNIAKEKGIMNILKTLAILEGDYNDGRNKAVILRQWIGPENFDIFRKEYPGEYKNLLEM